MNIFKKILLGLFAVVGTMAFVACSSDDGTDTPSSPVENISLQTTTPAEGAEIDASSTTTITLSYSATVAVSSSANITLNGTKVSPRISSVTATIVEIPVTLEAGKSYTLSVPSGSIVGKDDASRTAKSFTLNFTTKAAPTPSEFDDLSDASATEEAQALYDYLMSCYGEKTLSSVIADVNWNTKEADKIYKATGKYPAFNCYDFIQIYVPEGNGWIDYSDITPVTNWTNKGGLVQLMWHFNVPLTETTEIKSDGSGVTCTPSETTFKASNALKDGTWENKWFYEQMDKVIAVILKLQEKKIAAVWRPFHEAAGNATYKTTASWTTSWFWWGYDGADTFKQLWKAMYTYFQQNGVHNLIWVWTTQNYNGDSSKYNNDSNWYPGDDCVDIIGRDLYGYTAAQNATEFNEISSRYPNKMVTLAECGVNGETPFSEVADFWNGGAKWLYYMPWYGSSMPSDSWWKNAMNQSFVITRDQVKY